MTVGPAEPDLPARVKPVLISVSERRSQMLDFRAGVSTAEGIRGGFEYGYRNLFGKAIGLTLRVQLANQFFLDLSAGDQLNQRSKMGLLRQRHRLTLQDAQRADEIIGRKRRTLQAARRGGCNSAPQRQQRAHGVVELDLQLGLGHRSR